MRFGLAAPVEQSAVAKSAGFDFLEVPVRQLPGPEAISTPAPVVLSANDFLPDSMRIAGPQVTLEPIRMYVHQVCFHAELNDAKVLVFDGGLARSVDGDFDRKQARRQILEFLRMVLPFCARHGVMLVCQPLAPTRSNMINSLPEALQYVWEVDHPNFQCLLDIGTFVSAGEPMQNLRDALPWIRHVHVPGRFPDPRPLFAELKHAGYDGLITVTGSEPDDSYQLVLEFLKKQWSEA